MLLKEERKMDRSTEPRNGKRSSVCVFFRFVHMFVVGWMEWRKYILNIYA